MNAPIRHALTAATVAGIIAGAAMAAELTPGEKRGKQLYLRGTSASGREVSAVLGDENIEIPASALPCGSCHGHDGLGRPEGGVTPSNLTWEYLSKPYGHGHSGNRIHVPFSDETLKRAITQGVDPSGNELATAMPAYHMEPGDLVDLVAYLKQLDKDRDPGLSDETIRIGTVLPATGPLGEMGDVMRAVLEAYFEETNRSGGIYGRRVELVVEEFEGSGDTIAAQTRRLIDEQQVFAISAPVIVGDEGAFGGLVAAAEVPVVAPFTLFPQDDAPVNRYVFYLLSGLVQQARVAGGFAREVVENTDPSVAILHRRGERAGEIAAAMEEEARRSNWSRVQLVEHTPGEAGAETLAQRLAEQGVDVLFLAEWGAWESRLLHAGAEQGWTPFVFVPGAFIGSSILEIPSAYEAKVFAAVPTLPFDQTETGIEQLRELTDRYGIPPRHLTAQVSAYCAATILFEGIKRAGKNLSREKLITALEGLYEFDTGLTPLVSYGPNRRVGAQGAYMLAIDPARRRFVHASSWRAP